METPDFLAVSKPPGMETISMEGKNELTALVRQLRHEPGLMPVHRLDRNTSGAQLLARNAHAEEELVRLFRQRRVEKTYLAICLGTPRNATGRINRNVSEWGGGRHPVRVLKQGGLEASTTYRVLAQSMELPGSGGWRVSLLAFSPHQGRTHQIRVHAASFGYPIAGDDQYGERDANKALRAVLGLHRQALHSWQIAFPWHGRDMRIVCPPFPDMRDALEKAFGIPEPTAYAETRKNDDFVSPP